MSAQANSSTNMEKGSQRRFGFWQKWLVVMIEFYIMFGVLIAFLHNTVLFNFFDEQIARIFWETAVPQSISSYQSWLYGLLGSILIAWGVNMFFIARNAFEQQEKWAWNALFLGILIWYLSDTSISLHYGVLFNVVVNTILFGLGMLPLVLTRKYFT